MELQNLDYPALDIMLDDDQKRDELKAQMGFTDSELDLLAININPIKWAKAYLNWESRDYQDIMLETMRDMKLTTLRLGRRLGKSETMVISILWHAFVQPNKGPNNQYDILIICPYDEQVDLIFKRLAQLIETSDALKGSIKKDVHHRLVFHNGTVIRGLTAGSKSSTGAANTRGQRADLIVLDEVDYMGEDDITNIVNIRNEAPERIKIIAASTPSGDRSMYYRWCTESTKSYEYNREESEIQNKPIYTLKHNKEGNGWAHVHAPSTVNPELMKTNPDTGKTYLDELKATLTDMRYIQEVLAEFGESEMGVYQKQYIDRAIELGKTINLSYEETDYKKRGPRILGVDWDDSTSLLGELLERRVRQAGYNVTGNGKRERLKTAC